MKEKANNIIVFLFDILQFALTSFNDLFLRIRAKISGENPIGRYVGICNKTEKRRMFHNSIAGGYCGYVKIKLFAIPNCSDYEDCVEQILNHEVLHLVLDKVAGEEARKKLDTIQRSFYVLDCNANKWHFVVSFVLYKNGKQIII